MAMSNIKESLKNDKELFSAPIIRFDSNAADGSSANIPSVYQKVINDAKKYMNKAGALYIASEVMPFDLPSGNYKRVKYDSEAKKFLKTFTSPQPIPVIYNHNDGTDPFFVMEGKPDIAGRVLSVAIAEGIFKVPSIFAGQMIVNKESIERIQDMIDYTQSISYMPKGYICEECGLDGTSEECPHYPGQVIKDKNGKERRVVFTAIPDYAAELSFVLVPGYRNARVVAMEQNSVGGAPITSLKALSFYNKKIQEVVSFDRNEPLETTRGSSDTEDNSKLDDWKKKYKVPEEGEVYNNRTSSIVEKIKENPDRNGKWNAPSSQTARFEALDSANAKSWRDGFLKVEDGQLKYPFIDSSGKAMLSGVKAAKQRAGSQGDTKLVEICDKITREFEEENNSHQIIDNQNTCDTISKEFVMQEGPDMEKLLEVLNSLSAQMADQNKVLGEFVSSFKETNKSTVDKTEAVQTVVESNSATVGSSTETNSAQESSKELIALINTLVEQNKAILEKLEANVRASEAGSVPETEASTAESATPQMENNSSAEAAAQTEANNQSQGGASKTKKVVVTGLAKTLNGQL